MRECMKKFVQKMFKRNTVNVGGLPAIGAKVPC
jgi:hypothetical protein